MSGAQLACRRRAGRVRRWARYELTSADAGRASSNVRLDGRHDASSLLLARAAQSRIRRFSSQRYGGRAHHRTRSPESVRAWFCRGCGRPCAVAPTPSHDFGKRLARRRSSVAVHAALGNGWAFVRELWRHAAMGFVGSPPRRCAARSGLGWEREVGVGVWGQIARDGGVFSTR